MAATAMANAAAAHEQVLKDSGLRPDFVNRLRTATDDLSNAIEARRSHLDKRSGSTAGLVAEERRARSALRVLDSHVKSDLEGDSALLAEWRSKAAARRSPSS